MAKTKANKVKKTGKRVPQQKRQVSRGNITTVNTAPVAIGNSLSGFESRVTTIKDGVRVIGRDLAFTPIATGSATGWVLSGGIPLTPTCLVTSTLKNFCQMYNSFRFNRLAFHYITSSSTATNGDIVFYYSRSAGSQLPDNASNSFLSYVLSDSHTILGPQWTNHTMVVSPSQEWCSTDYGASQVDETAYSTGDVFVYSKTSSTQSPGYILVDYDVSFKEHCLNPRSGSLPNAKILWSPVSFTNATVCTADATAIALTASTAGVGSSTITAFTGTSGDIYEFIIDSTNSTYGAGSSASTALSYLPISTITTIALKDGMKLYICVNSSNSFKLYNSLGNAIGDSQGLRGHQTLTYADTYRGFAKFITSTNPSTFQSSY